MYYAGLQILFDKQFTGLNLNIENNNDKGNNKKNKKGYESDKWVYDSITWYYVGMRNVKSNYQSWVKNIFNSYRLRVWHTTLVV